jgi:hypothetical protein
MRILLLALLLVPTFAFAQTDDHRPIISTGVRELDENEASACVYVSLYDKWIVSIQRRICAYDWDGSSFTNRVCTVDAHPHDDMEGFAQVVETGSQYLYILNERTEAIYRVDLAEWNTAGWSDNFTFTGTKLWDVGDAIDNREGFAFVPGSCTAGLPGGCEGSGRFWVGWQGGGGTIEVYELAISDTTSSMVATYTPHSPADCYLSDVCGIEYDWDADQVWLQDDNVYDRMCAATTTGTAIAGTDFVTTTGVHSNFEGMCWAAPGTTDAGWYMMTNDNQSSPEDGLVMYEDSYCGDDIASSAETCDGTDLDGKDCTNCGEGTCGGGMNPGGLACAATCDAFDTSGCTTASGRRRLILTGVVP